MGLSLNIALLRCLSVQENSHFLGFRNHFRLTCDRGTTSIVAEATLQELRLKLLFCGRLAARVETHDSSTLACALDLFHILFILSGGRVGMLLC